MSRRKVQAVAFYFAVFVALGGTASADPVQITSGVLRISGAQDVMSRGFLRSTFYDLFIDDFSLSWADSDGPTQNVFAPRLLTPSNYTPTDGTDELVTVQSNLLITTTPSASPTPFLLSGTVSILDRVTGATLFADAVVGSGTATWQFVTSPGGTTPLVSGVTYEFSDAAPVPEPATLWLLGSGLAAIAARHRRRRRAP